MKRYCKHKDLSRPILYFIFGVCLTLSGQSGLKLVPCVSAQPFMNSLAVLFRSRPPWPTTFPPSANGNSGSFQVFHNIAKNPGGAVPSPLLASATSQQGILVAHPVPSKQYPTHYRKPLRPNFGPPPSSHRQQFFLNKNNPPLITHVSQSPQGGSSKASGNFRFPDIPTPPNFQSMTGGDLPLRFNNWHSSKEHHSIGSSSQKALDFRPSPQLLDSSFGYGKSHEIVDGKLSTPFQATEAKRLPKYESGFHPMTFNHFVSNDITTSTATTPLHFQNSQQNYYNPWTFPLSPTYNSFTFPEISTISPLDNGRQIVNAEVSNSVVTTDFTVEEAKPGEGNDSVFGPKLTSSSERVEDWISSQPKSSKSVNSGEKHKFPVYKKRVRPIKCEKFHRYGFCPVTSNYPLTQVEKIASRCSALLSHLIAPLSKTDVHYDIVVTRNGNLRGRSSTLGGPGRRGWNWRDYRGRPICDTEEIKIVPGWAKNGDGDWLVILQTQLWKQEAQVSICSPPGSHSQCQGESCEKDFLSGSFKNTKCVQRFTAQRLAVLDPENQDRCPVVRSVFLPSACVCLSDDPVMEERFGESLEFQDTSNRESSSEHIPIILPSMSPNINNGTYMIVSEKYSTKESSTESHEVT